MKMGINDPRAFAARVFLDGIEQTHCTYADEEGGFIERYVLGEDGHPVVDGQHVRKETVHGTVRIEL